MHNKTERNMDKEKKSARNEIKDTLLLSNTLLLQLNVV